MRAIASAKGLAPGVYKGRIIVATNGGVRNSPREVKLKFTVKKAGETKKAKLTVSTDSIHLAAKKGERSKAEELVIGNSTPGTTLRWELRDVGPFEWRMKAGAIVVELDNRWLTITPTFSGMLTSPGTGDTAKVQLSLLAQHALGKGDPGDEFSTTLKVLAPDAEDGEKVGQVTF